MAIALLLGIWLVASGLVCLIEAFGRFEPHRVWDLMVAAIEVVVGVIIVADLRIALSTFALILGIAFVLRGLGMTILAWNLRGARQH